MDSRLKETINLDAGMKQFTEEYERVTADPKLRDEHAMYVMECMRQNGMKRFARQEGLEQGLEQAREEGRIAMLATAKKLLAMNMSSEQVSQATGLPITEVNGLI
jgi:predicted transposase/invertase (TIGR01784 family)